MAVSSGRQRPEGGRFHGCRGLPPVSRHGAPSQIWMRISAWILSPDTDTAMPVLAGKPATVYSNPEAATAGTGWDNAGTYGILCITGRYAVERRDDGTVVVYDLVENSHSEPYQLVLSAENRLDITVSPDGAKLLLAERNREDGMLIRLSVLDMSADCFTSIGRDPSAVGNEHRADWFDENTVLVDNNTYDAAGNNTGESWYYLYRIGAYSCDAKNSGGPVNGLLLVRF